MASHRRWQAGTGRAHRREIEDMQDGKSGLRKKTGLALLGVVLLYWISFPAKCCC
nr:hypothetical protein [Pseudoxanthomonas sp.]